MRSLARTALLVLAMSIASFADAADGDGTIVQTGSISNLGETSIELAQFDPEGGTLRLDAVEIDVTAGMFGGATISGSGVPVTLTITFTQDYFLGPDFLLGTSCVFENTFPNRAMIAFSFFISDADSTSIEALEPWIGDATIKLTSTGVFTVVADPPDEVLDAGAGLSADYTVTYFYSRVAACPGDLDGDMTVGFADLLAVLSVWGPCPGCPGDLDGDDMVDFADLLIVLSTWGPCP